MNNLQAYSIYIHIPWCVKKCPYCDFNSHEMNIQNHTLDVEIEEKYINQLMNDLDIRIEFAKDIKQRKLQSIFLGGGTPSLLSSQALDKLLSYIDKKLGIDLNTEITLEANPGTFEYEKFISYKNAGINRISLGVQSLSDHALKALGRIHQSNEALIAIEKALNIFSRVNVDLMYALPNQSVQQALSDVKQVISMGVKHLSWYQLTMEPNTVFYTKKPQGIPVEQSIEQMEDEVFLFLQKQNINRYEISAFAEFGEESQHNLNYWQFGDYLGIGAGAHGKWTDYQTQKVYRSQRTRLPKDYMDKSLKQAMDIKQVAIEDLPYEFFMNWFRLRDVSIPQKAFVDKTFLSTDVIKSQIESLVAKGLLKQQQSSWQLTDLGKLFVNDAIEAFVSSH